MKDNYLLAIETATNICSVCLTLGQEILGEYTLYDKNSADRFLASLTKRILEDNFISIENLTVITISSGPGSFTGLRIGSAFAKGLCFDDKIKLVSVPTLSAIAFSNLEFAIYLKSDRILVLLPSHKDIYYFQFFNLDGEPITNVEWKPISEIQNLIGAKDFICGVGIKDFLTERIIRNSNRFTAKDVAILGWKLYQNGKTIQSQEFVPDYYQQFKPNIF